MSKNNMICLSLITISILNLFTKVVFGDIAPDPLPSKPSVLLIVLIIAVVVLAVVLLVKFFKK